MNKTNSLVLITTASSPPEGVFALAMTNISKRIITAKAAIFFWAASGVEKIVIADATNQVLLNDAEIVMLNEMNVEVEQIHYLQNNEMILKKGKGYGEGELIEFAINNSRFILSSDNFFKCTGKVYCRNFSEIFKMIDLHSIRNIFWKDVFEGKLDTRFFYTSKEFCINHLIPVYKNIDDYKEMNAENLFFKVVNESLNSGQATRPLLSGFAGGTNQPYFDQGMGFLDQNLACWFGK